MARVTYGSGVTELAGSIGGVTFQKNASGNIAKLRANPVVNPSGLQSEKQTVFAIIVNNWSSLSQANKDLWNALALAHDHTTPWGETKTLSGYQWFTLCNLHRNLAFDTITHSPGGWYAPPVPAQFTIETSSTYIRAAWSPDYDPPESIMAYVTLPLRQSSIKLRRSLFYLTYLLDPGAMSNWDLTSYIEDLFNVTWSTFYASADCSIIIRLRTGRIYAGYFSAFTSAIVKI